LDSNVLLLTSMKSWFQDDSNRIAYLLL